MGRRLESQADAMAVCMHDVNADGITDADDLADASAQDEHAVSRF